MEFFAEAWHGSISDTDLTKTSAFEIPLNF
jgi:hypothetical protein